MEIVDSLRGRAVDQRTLRIEGNYTSPRSFGVYRIPSSSLVRRRYRYGNHPVRQNELIRDYGDCTLEAIFLVRDDAKNLADHLNSA